MPPAGIYGPGSGSWSRPSFGYVVATGLILELGTIPDPIELAFTAPVIDGVPLNGVCGSLVGIVRAGAAESGGVVVAALATGGAGPAKV